MDIFAQAIQLSGAGFLGHYGLKNPLQSGHPLRIKSTSGVAVSNQTAMTLSAYFHGVNLISNHLAMLPFKVYKPESPGSDNMVCSYDHAVTQRLHYEADSDRMTSFWLRKAMNIHMLNWGNAFAKIHRERGQVSRLELIEPWRMRILKDPETNILTYKIAGDDRSYDWSQILHVFQFSYDGLIGKSVIEFAKDRMGGHLAAEQYGESFFGNGTHMGGMLISKQSFGNDAQVAEEAKSEIRKELEQIYSGPDNFMKIGIFDGEMEYRPLHLKASDVQLIERMKFSVDDVSRWLHIPPHKLNSLERSTNNNIEHQSIEYVQDTLLPRVSIWEQETRRRLFTQSEKDSGYHTKINLNGLLRGDVKTRGEFYQRMLDRGVFTPNDVLRLEDMNTYPEGNKHFMQQNYQFIEDQQ